VGTLEKQRQITDNKYEFLCIRIKWFSAGWHKRFQTSYRCHLQTLVQIILDRYRILRNYIDSKFRITMNQTGEDYLLYDADDEAINAW
jgi:UDP-N-acetylmuramoylalanine--D-glutamate ligase